VSDSTGSDQGLQWLNAVPPEDREWLVSHHSSAVLVECGRLLQDPQYAQVDFERVLLRAQYLVKLPLYQEIEEAASRPLASGRLELIPIDDWTPEA
jgi:hypothetical protein